MSHRLQTIFSLLDPAKELWDFCCDHGYLGQAALEVRTHQAQAFPQVHFVDQVPQIIQSLQQRLNQLEASDDGIQGVHFHALGGEDLGIPVEGNLVIAGVGAATVERILSKLHQKGLLKADILVLGPQRDAQKLQDWLLAQEWAYELQDMVRVIERGRERKLFILKRQFNGSPLKPTAN